MLIQKTFRYRVYPTKGQADRLSRWEEAQRLLWNLGHGQRLIGTDRSRGERRYPTAFDQHKELTALRAVAQWLADVPRGLCESTLTELDKAWQRCFTRLATNPPRWKRKSEAAPGLSEMHPESWSLKKTGVRFPKLGVLRAVIHRRAEGKPKTCTLKRDGDQWFASIVCQVEIADPVPRVAPVLAIDRGITNLLADSDGNLTTNPKHYDKALKRLARAQRDMARKQKGSKNREKAKVRVVRIHRKVRRQRDHFLHCLSATIAKSNGVVVIEKLQVANMVRNRCLSRSIASAGWSRFAAMLRYKLQWSGGSLVEVPAQYSSQTCSACGLIDAQSRCAERFSCVACGYVDHADLNAAKVLKHRANRSVKPVDGILLAGTGRSGKGSVRLRTPQRNATNMGALNVVSLGLRQ